MALGSLEKLGCGGVFLPFLLSLNPLSAFPLWKPHKPLGSCFDELILAALGSGFEQGEGDTPGHT